MSSTRNTPFESEQQDRERARQAERFTTLYEQDAQFRACLALPAVVEAKRQPGLRLAEVVKIAMEGYSERPALAQRAIEWRTDTQGRRSRELLPAFETISYAQLWQRSRALAAAWHYHPQALLAEQFICILGFASIDYATQILASIHLGATIVPLQTSAPPANHTAIMAETGAHLLATGIDYLDAAISAVLEGYSPARLVVFDVEEHDDNHRDALHSARQRLEAAGCTIAVETANSLIAEADGLPEPPLFAPPAERDPLAWLFYTSGTTGTPKGAMFPQSLVINTWLLELPLPVITLSFMPMSHLVGNGFMLMTLGCGGTSYCSPKSDLSTLFEDFPLARPTMVSLVPRVCEMFYQHYLRELDRRLATNSDSVEQAQIEAAIKREMREQLLGGRLFSAGTGSAALAPEIYAFMESMLDMHMSIGYASTEIGGGTVLVDGKVQRPLVIDYKLDDVPELGYFKTDKPYPRGELLVKTSQFMAGYFKRPELTAERLDAEGFYRTGDVMAELGPDQLVFVDRCNNVIKLSQGEFVAVAKLEACYSQSPLIHQIYIYGTSERAFLLAVIVPDPHLLTGDDRKGNNPEHIKAAIRQSMQDIAEANGLNGYELPRDFIIETEPFSHANGLISEIGKHLRPKLKQRYGDTLEHLYADMAREQVNELRALRTAGADRPVMDTVIRALRATLGLSIAELSPQDRFTDLGGDSLSALEYSKLLCDIFAVEVPVGVIINPAGNLQAIADLISSERSASQPRATATSVHGKDTKTLQAGDLTLEQFFDPAPLSTAPLLPAGDASVHCVLLTGATGYLGRFLALAWLEKLAKSGGKLILVARGRDTAQARQRVIDVFSSDPECLALFDQLATDHLEVLAGDLSSPGLGLGEADWQRLADSVDLIVHCGAHVNHVLPYNQLFAANVAGTAELIRLALTTRRKPFHYISTLGVSMLCHGGLVDEDGDIREQAPNAALGDGYANGYNLSKWASEVLLRDAHQRFSLPVSVFRPGMILAHSHYRGQLNVPDMFTRLLFSLVATGVAPATFYAQDLSAGRPAARYEGFSVDFLATTIATTVADDRAFHSYNAAGGDAVARSLDDVVDWLIDSGCAIERIERYDEWLARFETALQALPETQQQQSLIALLAPYRHPQVAAAEAVLDSRRFAAAATTAGIEPAGLSAQLIGKYVDDLRALRYL